MSALPSFFKDIKLTHSLFALPFAVSIFTFFNISNVRRFDWVFFVAILVCIISARTFAMGLNRYLDSDIDAENERTKLRAIPGGLIAKKSVLQISLTAGLIFVAASFLIRPLCGFLSIGVLLVLGSYPLMKKMSILTHYYLGFCLALAPLGVAVSVSNDLGFSASIYLVSAAVMLWTGGFDIIYSLQDIAFDRANKLYSIPVRFGVKTALYISQVSFLSMVLCLIGAGYLAHKSWIYYVGVAMVATILTAEHVLIRDAVLNDGRSKHIDVAFFNLNAFSSVFFFVFCAIDLQQTF